MTKQTLQFAISRTKGWRIARINRGLRTQSQLNPTDQELLDMCKSFIVGQHPIVLRLFPWLLPLVIPTDIELLKLLKY